MSDKALRSGLAPRRPIRVRPAGRRLPSRSIIGFGVAILIFAAVAAALLVKNGLGKDSVTSRHAGIGLKIASLANGALMSAVLSELGPPDNQKTDGEYTQWMYCETRLVESRTRTNSILPGLSLQSKHKLVQQGTNYILFFKGDTLVGRPPKEWEWHVLYRRLNPPQPFPPYPLANGSDLHTVLSSIVDRRTTLEELDGLLGKPWRVLRKDNLQVPYYRIAVPGGWISLYIFVKDGIVVRTPYSASETEADEADREPFYDLASWPDYPRFWDDLTGGNP